MLGTAEVQDQRALEIELLLHFVQNPRGIHFGLCLLREPAFIFLQPGTDVKQPVIVHNAFLTTPPFDSQMSSGYSMTTM